MRERAQMNAMRSGVVVLGALAFSYLTFRLGFRPFLENAERTMEQQQQQQQQQHLVQPQDLEFDGSHSSSSDKF